MSLIEVSRQLTKRGDAHVVVAADWRTNIFVLVTDMAKRIHGRVVMIELGRVTVKRGPVDLGKGQHRDGWVLPITKLLPTDYFTKRLRGFVVPEKNNISLRLALKRLQETRVACVDPGPEGLPNDGLSTSPGAYYSRRGNMIVLPQNTDRETTEHELRHAFDEMANILLSYASNFSSESYQRYGAEYLLNVNEVRARLQAWVLAVRAGVANIVARANAGMQTLRLEYSEENRKLGYAPEPGWIKGNAKRANESRAFLKRVLFSTTRPTNAGLLEFAKWCYDVDIRSDIGTLMPEATVAKDSARLIRLTRDAVLDSLMDKRPATIDDAEPDTTRRGLDEIESTLRSLFRDLRTEYAGVIMRQVETRPLKGKGSRSPLKVSNEPTPEPSLPHDSELHYRKQYLEGQRRAAEYEKTQRKNRKGNA